jgi:hypothetical protein
MRGSLVVALACLSCSSTPGSLFSPRPVNPVAIERACAMEVSCFTSPPITPGGSCVTQFEVGLATGTGIFFGPSAQDLERYIDCANSSSSCTAALTCASRNHGPDWCNAHPSATCDGDTLVGCVGGWGLELADCTSVGLHCNTANGSSSCNDGKACDPTAAAFCNGSQLVTCDSVTKLESRIDCATIFSGGRCVSTTSGTSSSTGCVPAPSPGCAADGATCDGKTAVVCSLGAQFRVDCGQFASHCAVDPMGKFACVPDATNCASSMPDSCVGDSLELCANGSLVQERCTDIGLTTCDATAAARCK